METEERKKKERKEEKDGKEEKVGKSQCDYVPGNGKILFAVSFLAYVRHTIFVLNHLL